MTVARAGVAILARTVFLESVGRCGRIFEKTPPVIFAQFTERVPMVKGKVDPKATTATGYASFIWCVGETPGSGTGMGTAVSEAARARRRLWPAAQASLAL